MPSNTGTSSWAAWRNARYASKKRLDLQGLRALAVGVVIADHLFHWPSGGFIGVDVFFVLSGFLITGLLLREYERTGRVSPVEFYRRRVRRIMPLALLVSGLTVAVAFALLLRTRAIEVMWDGIASALFAANWRFASVGTDYFAGTGAPSPLQHFWSLAVEEQFYFVWPWLMIAVLAIVLRVVERRDRRTINVVAGLLIGAISLISFAWALYESATSPTVAYFSTFTRAWELGIGAILAAMAPLFARIPVVVRLPLAYLGLAGIVAGLFLVTPESVFPAPWALLPVLCTAAVIVAGTGVEQRRVMPFLAPLTNPVMTYLGDISYSLYLWHFPVIVFAAVLQPELTPVLAVIVLVITLVLSVGSYHLIETPIQASPLLNRYERSYERVEAWSSWRRRFGPLYKWMSFGYLALAAVVVVGTVALIPQSDPVEASTTAAAAAPVATDTGAPVAPEVQAVKDEVTAALNSSTWPELNPSLDALSKDQLAAPWVTDGCLGREVKSLPDPIANAQRCVYGNPDGANTAVLLGDSVAISWAPAIIAALPYGWRLDVWTVTQCAAGDVPVKLGDGSVNSACPGFRTWVNAQFAEDHYQLVLMADADTTVNRTIAAEGSTPKQSYQAGLESELALASAAADRVVFLGNPSEITPQLRECATAVNRPIDCEANMADTGHLNREELRTAATANAPDNVSFLDTDALFCNDAGRCPTFAAGMPILVDNAHMTNAYSTHLGPALRVLLGL
ncbi:acyltransferase [Microbacteriaceae bacterium VKM Ac-2854]|nr:acyltransferase [Microbacteriaceae bacterium VKM Ac-2854]